MGLSFVTEIAHISSNFRQVSLHHHYVSVSTKGANDMSDSTHYDDCVSLAEPIAAGVHAMYAEIGSRAGLGEYADAVAAIPADFVGPPGGGWEAVCATMFDAPAQASAHEQSAPTSHEDGNTSTGTSSGSTSHGDAGGSSDGGAAAGSGAGSGAGE